MRGRKRWKLEVSLHAERFVCGHIKCWPAVISLPSSHLAYVVVSSVSNLFATHKKMSEAHMWLKKDCDAAKYQSFRALYLRHQQRHIFHFEEGKSSFLVPWFGAPIASAFVSCHAALVPFVQFFCNSVSSIFPFQACRPNVPLWTVFEWYI